MKFVAYLRVSGQGQATDGYGLDTQRADVRRWAKTHGHRIVAIHVDAGCSGALDAQDRPALAEAMEDMAQGKADGLLVPRLDRLARAVTVQEATLALVWRAGGKVYTVDQGEVLPDDPDDPMRTAMRQVMGVFAELERRVVVKRMRDGRAAKAATGRKSVGAYRYGYEGAGKGRERDAAPRADEQAAVRRIVELRREGASYRQIAAALDAEGHRPRRAASWSAAAVRNVAVRELAGAGAR